MIFFNPEIADGVLKTRRGIYSLSPEIDAIPDRMFLAPGVIGAALITLFIFGFFDILYFGEIAICAGVALACASGGVCFARLVLVKSTLRGSEHAVAAYGSYAAMLRLAEDIVEAAQAEREDRA